jgi:hypothetical protein
VAPPRADVAENPSSWRLAGGVDIWLVAWQRHAVSQRT